MRRWDACARVLVLLLEASASVEDEGLSVVGEDSEGVGG